MKHTTLTLTLASVTAALLIGCGGGSSLEDDLKKANEDQYSYIEYAPYPAEPISEAQKAEYLNAINSARSQQQDCGEYGIMQPVPPLQWSEVLYRAAYEHSVDMHDTGVFEHDGSGSSSDWTATQSNLDRGSTPSERAVGNGSKRGVGENIAMGYRSTAEVINAWLSSPGHCSLLMSPYHFTVGMARVGKYWTQDFGL